MHLFLTSVLPFLAHDHPSAVAFLTCRHHNFHSSIIPEFLSDEERVRSFCEARQRNERKADEKTPYKNMCSLFVQTPLMQFSPSLVIRQDDYAELILKPLLKTKYFTRTLQRCDVKCSLSSNLLQALSNVQSLTKLDLGWCEVKNEHFEIIINSFPSLEILTIYYATCLDSKTVIINSPPPPATKTLRTLTLRWCNALFVLQFVPLFPNLRKLELSTYNESQELDLLFLASSRLLLKDLFLAKFTLKNTESIKNLVHLSSLALNFCALPDSLNFLTQENALPELTRLRIDGCQRVSTSSFASLTHAPNLHVLEVNSYEFDDDCLEYLENMVHLRKLDLSSTDIVGDSRSLKTMMQNLFQLEELNLSGTFVGNQGAVAGSLYNTRRRLRVLHLSHCDLVDDDLDGIGALKNTLEVLDLSDNSHLTKEALVRCKDLHKLKKLKLNQNSNINDLSPLKDCLNLEDLDVSYCYGLIDDSFKVFSDEPNSFPNLRILNRPFGGKSTEKVFEHLAKNNNLRYRLKELDVEGMSEILLSSETARNNLCKMKGLRQLRGMFSWLTKDVLNFGIVQNLKNLDTIEYY